MDRSPDPGMVRIDGSYGEGGGQVLRTSLALSCVLGKPFTITKIRAARKRPGLQPQHLAAVRAAAAVGRAVVQGAELSSQTVAFRPTGTRDGAFLADVAEKTGSAGSVTLVLQTVLLPLSFRDHASTITVTGGTHVPWSPPFHYLRDIVAPVLGRLGVRTGFTISSWGWYPQGEGMVTAQVMPGCERPPLTLVDRGALLGVSGISAVSNLPDHISRRQRDRACAVLGRSGIDAQIDLLAAPSAGKGSFLFLRAEFAHLSAGFSSLGAIGKRAEEVADEACTGLLSHLRAHGALDPHLADQMVPWLAFCRGTSEMTTSRVTRHLLTNLWVLQQFMDIVVEVDGREGAEGRITIRPR
jgi:RNA 3'-terminal phosphate cyclase (ATP)